MQSETEPDELAAAEAVLVEQCPNLEERLAVLHRLLITADAANAIAPNAWAVTLFVNGFRLNIGQVEAVIFIDGGLRINLSASVGTKPFVGQNFVAAGYRSLPQPLCAFVGTPQQYLPLAAELELAHMRFVQLAATGSSGMPRRGTPFLRSHCEGLVQYARSTQAKPAA
ncbi:MAG: hypothetical protein ACYCUI_14750 [Vulcanimicrobiaceae bacterium]|jgi:hypothetical protein